VRCFPHKFGYDTVAQLQLEFKAAMATQGYTVAVPPGTQVRTLTLVFSALMFMLATQSFVLHTLLC
jgi:hypothetical protein